MYVVQFFDRREKFYTDDFIDAMNKYNKAKVNGEDVEIAQLTDNGYVDI